MIAVMIAVTMMAAMMATMLVPPPLDLSSESCCSRLRAWSLAVLRSLAA